MIELCTCAKTGNDLGLCCCCCGEDGMDGGGICEWMKKCDQKKKEELEEEREMENMEWIVRFVPKSRRPSRLPVAPRYRFGF